MADTMFPTRQDYDSPWKEIIERFFRQFMAFFFPQAHAGIEWSRGYTFLDKEFQQVTRDAKTGKRYVDKLVKVFLLDGRETWILIHIEVQGEKEETFEERMFIYHYRIYDQYRRRVVSLAILTDDQIDWRPHHFGYELFGCRLSLDFPTVKLLDYRHRLDELEKDVNPFAVVVMACLQTQVTHHKPTQRYEAKLALIKFLYQQGYQRQEIAELLRFIDWIMTLPSGLELQLRTDVEQFEAEINMRYVTSFERLAKEEGVQKGSLEKAQTLIRRTLELRFGNVPLTVIEVIEAIEDVEVLDILHDQAVTADSLASFLEALAAYEKEPVK